MTKMNTLHAARVVMNYPNQAGEPEHERVVHRVLAQRLARLLGLPYAGEFDPASPGDAGARRYLVPSATLVGVDQAAVLGLHGEADLFGGVVPYPYVGTKSISHPLVRPDAHAPEGWSFAFGEQVRESVLGGYTAFTLEDAREAGLCLLQRGPVRLKPVLAKAGRGQRLITGPSELDQALAQVEQGDMAQCGLVLEANLTDVVTMSVGQVRVGEHIATYHGTQGLTSDNDGESVYGGSELVVVKGGFDSLLQLDLPADIRRAVAQAQVYDRAASACYHGFFASRRNYDVVLGTGADGLRCGGVLEQSWRIGGASSAEIAALEAFSREGGPTRVRAVSMERYGEHPELPRGADILYQGRDAQVGFITKCVMVEDYGGEQ